MRRRRPLLSCMRCALARMLLALLAGVALACSRPEAPAASATEVLVSPVVQRDVPLISEWIGTLSGSVNAAIHPKVEGYLLRRTYKEGQHVVRGDPLFEIDPRQFEAALGQARGQLDQAEAQLAKADIDVKRLRPLAKSQAVSQQELDDATSAQRGAAAAVRAARAAVEQASLSLEWTKVTSPIDGIAGLAKVDVGDLVNPQMLMASVSTVDPIRVRFAISEREYLQYAARINRSDYATTEQGPFLQLVLVDGTVYGQEGRVLVADREVDPRTGTMLVDGYFPNPGNILRPGQYARVRATLQTKTAALLVPQRAVSELQGGFQVALVGADGKAEIRSVEPAEKTGSLWVIDKGLAAGEQVIVGGGQFVRAGMPVRAVRAPSESDAAVAAGERTVPGGARE